MYDKEKFNKETSERLITIKYLLNIDKESLNNSFVVFCVDINTTFLVNGRGWSEEQRMEYIKELINEIQAEKNLSIKNIMQNGNIYFVY